MTLAQKSNCKLFYYPRNASWAPHMLLAEMGASYELVLVDRKSEAQKSTEYLQLNPTGRIPTLVDGDIVLYESAAICLHLCDRYPQAGLIPALGSQTRPLFYQWLFYLTTTLQPTLMLYFYPEKHTSAPGDTALISQTQEIRATGMFALLDKELAGKDFLVGDGITVCDFFLFMLSHWASEFKTPPLSFPNLGQYLRNLSHRPSVKKVCELEGTDLGAYS